MEKHKIDSLFSDGLANHEIVPETGSWKAIIKELDHKSKRPWEWLWIAASAILVLLSGLWVVTSNEQDVTEEPVEISQSHRPTVEIAVRPELPFFIRLNPVKSQPLTMHVAEIKSPSQSVSDKLKIDNDALILSNNETPKHTGAVMRLSSVPEATLKPVLKEPIVMGSSEKENGRFDDEVVIASARPVTIIYKQGEKKKKSKFSKALTYMDEVRKGEKKLINFQAIKANLKAKRKERKNSP